MAYRYYICDVFSARQFGGNPLAVIPDAQGLTTEQMQKIAREFNFSESTFVFPAESSDNHRNVRIFTPSREVPFAGHPNVGTAFALTHNRDLVLGEDENTILFEEVAGIVPVEVVGSPQQGLHFRLTAPEPLSLGKRIPTDLVAQALSLNVNDILVSGHQPVVASVGLPFILVEVINSAALGRAKIDIRGFEQISALGVMPDIHVYTKSAVDCDIQTRMFAPFDGVNEDPATGSANSALAALLANINQQPSGEFNWHIMQGREMGRPSTMLAYAHKQDGKVSRCGVAGQAVMFASGELFV